MGFGELIRDDGNIRMDPIRTYAGGDFNQRDDAWYFSKEEGTAEKYRGYAAKRCPQSEIWIINMQVPKGFIDGVRKKELWYSPDWKQFVWSCRNGDSVSSPAKFDSYHPPQTQFIEGHICGRNPAIILKIKKEDVQQEMSENNLLYLGTRKATQSVFVDKPTVVEMAKLIRGKIFIDVFPPNNTSV